jgi:hypothetical protein
LRNIEEGFNGHRAKEENTQAFWEFGLSLAKPNIALPTVHCMSMGIEHCIENHMH